MPKVRLTGWLAVLMLLASLLLVACGDNTATTAPAATSAAATTAAATTAAATTAATATTAAAATTAATTSASATTAAAGATNGKKLKVGLVTDVGRVDDKSFNQSAWEGVQQAGKELGWEVKFIETKDTKDYAKNIKQFLDDKYDVIVTVGFLIGDATIDAAKANPNVKFIGVDQFQATTVPNLAGLVFDEDKSGFLAGALAAGMSKSGKIAAIVGTKSVPPVVKYAEGYKAGAAYLYDNYAKLVPSGKKPEVILNYHPDGDNAFNDPTWGALQAQNVIQSGADVVFGGGGSTGNGAVESTAEKGVYAIGVDTDQYYTLPKAAPKLLSSAMKLLTKGTYDILKGIASDKFQGGNNVGESGLAPFHDTDANVPAELKDVLKKIDAGLKDGSIKTGVKVG
ncbi:MAG TPA: BMP family ABC transporter substrate-binding protein [Chloroflexia bacterium]|nr:BMP family ABC transporter substrate-binding protein [Chloroflexia bacterium]